MRFTRIITIILLVAFVLLEAFQAATIMDHEDRLNSTTIILVDHDDRLQVMEAPPEEAWRDIAIDATIPYTPPVWPRPIISLKADTMTRCHVCRHPAGHDGSTTVVLARYPESPIYEEVKRYKGLKKIEARPMQKVFYLCKECASKLDGFMFIQTVTEEDKDNG